MRTTLAFERLRTVSATVRLRLGEAAALTLPGRPDDDGEWVDAEERRLLMRDGATDD